MDEFAAAQARLPRGNTISWYEKVTPELTAEQVVKLDAALASPDISARAIAVVLDGWGHQVKEGTISKWRKFRLGRYAR